MVVIVLSAGLVVGGGAEWLYSVYRNQPQNVWAYKVTFGGFWTAFSDRKVGKTCPQKPGIARIALHVFLFVPGPTPRLGHWLSL